MVVQKERKFQVELWLAGKKLGKKLGQWRRLTAYSPGPFHDDWSVEAFIAAAEAEFPDAIIDVDTAKEIFDGKET